MPRDKDASSSLLELPVYKVLEVMEEPVYIIDSRASRGNRALEQMLEKMPPEEREGVVGAIMDSVSGRRRKIEIDGRIYDPRPVQLSGGEDKLTLVLFYDVTREEEAKKLITDINTMSRHKAKNDLAVISLALEMINDICKRVSPEVVGKEKKERLDRFVLEASKRDESLASYFDSLRELDDYILGKRPWVEPVDLDRTLRETISSLREEERVSYRPRDGKYIIAGNRIMLSGIFTSLVRNALKYSESEVVVELYREVLDEKEYAVVEVRDRGIGVPPDYKEKIFERGVRAPNVGDIRGTGKGLYLVKRFVDFHRGKIEVLDNKPRGTIFRVYFPFDVDR